MAQSEIVVNPSWKIPVIEQSASGDPRAVVVMLHGIFSEKTEDSRFTRLASLLNSNGFSTLQFDYTGHGEHSRGSVEFTLGSALTDYRRVFHRAAAMANGKPVRVIASSFGGSLALLERQMHRPLHIDRLVLLNPVTDYIETFVVPRCSVMQEKFSPSMQKNIDRDGVYEFPDDGFVMSLSLFTEMQLAKPFLGFETELPPTLVIHGTSDTAVPFSVVKNQAGRARNLQFEEIGGADHAFVEPEHEAISFDMMLKFI